MANISIHPRVSQGGEKSNTCTPSQSPGKPLRKKSKELNRRQLSCEGTRRSIKNPEAFRMPGSLKGK